VSIVISVCAKRVPAKSTNLARVCKEGEGEGSVQLGKSIRTLRLERGWTQVELGFIAIISAVFTSLTSSGESAR
jgi:hypothetical protein